MKLRIDYYAHDSLEMDSSLCYSCNISQGAASLEVSELEYCTYHSPSDSRLVGLNQGLDDELSLSLGRHDRRAKKKKNEKNFGEETLKQIITTLRENGE
jgi:hypothetical protein